MLGDPYRAGMAIVLWIGMMIIAQAFQATRASMRRRSRRAAAGNRVRGVHDGEERPARGRLGGAAGGFSESLIAEFQKSDTWIHGAFASSRDSSLPP